MDGHYWLDADARRRDRRHAALDAGPWPAPRRLFRERPAVDDATWASARARVLLPALPGVRYYETSVPAFAEPSRRRLDAVLGDPTLG